MMRKLKFVLFLIIALLTVVFSGTIVEVFAAGMADKTFNVNVTTIVDDDTSATTPITNQQHGKRDLSIDLSALIAADYNFAFYIVNGKKYTSLDQNFTVTSNLNVIAVLKPADKFVAVFLDSNGKLVGYDYVSEGFAPTAPSTASLSKPGYQINALQPWTVAIGPLTSDQIYLVNYEKSSTSDITIAVTGGTGAGSYAYNTIVTVEATSENFSHWTDDLGQIVSYNEQYSFTAVKNRTLTAVDGTPTPTPIISMIDVTGIRSGYNSYLGQYELPAGYEFIEAGFLYSSVYVNNLTLDTPNVQIVQSSAFTSSTKEFLRSATTSDSRLVRAYLVAKQGENAAITYYSSVESPENNTGLMIWEVYGGGGNSGAPYDRDYVVLYNGTNAAIDLTGYTIQYGGPTDALSVKATLTGAIVSQGYYVVADENAGDVGSAIPFAINQYASSLLFGATNGKVALAMNSTIITSANDVTLVDVMGYGTANTYEGTATAALSNSTSAKRSTTTDTNNNAADFTNATLDVAYLPSNTTFYTITFESNGGSNVEALTNISYGRKVTLSVSTKEGFDFAGWFTDTELTNQFVESTYIKQNYTLYAKWTIAEELPDFDTITLDINDTIHSGTGSYSSSTLVAYDSNIEFNAFDTLKSGTYIQFRASTGEIWNKTSLGEIYSIVVTIEAGANFSLFVGTSLDDTTLEVEPTYVGNKYTYNINSLESTYDYFVFHNDSTSIQISSLIVNYFAPTFYTVTYELNGGSGTSSSFVWENKTLSLPANPTRTGYSFAGWYTNAELSNQFNEEMLVNSNFTLYAKWTELPKYTITFDSNGGSDVDAISDIVSGTTIAELPTPTKTDYNFAGWFFDNNTFAQQLTTSTQITSDKTVYAKWREKVVTYTATIDTSGKFTTGISDGVIPTERLTLTNDGSASFTVSFYKNSSGTITIFNNSGGEIRLYGGSGNGGQLTISIGTGYLITNIKIETKTNSGYSINDGPTITSNNEITDFISGTNSIIIKNVASGTNQVQITGITFTYIPG